ncbi:unnamed protein product [Alopecurus aequalis]
MEFSRRGPATDGAAGSHHCLDPPPHDDEMLVMRDALLWQLHKDRLRQEIIVAELTKIECAMALHAASGNRTMPMPWDSMPQRKEPLFNWEPKHYGDLGEEHDVKLPKNDGNQSAESKFWKPVVEDCADECWNPGTYKCNVGQENTAFDVPELRDSDETGLSNKTSQAVKWELTEITMAVKKPKRKWSCGICQVQVTSEKVQWQHCAGKKHRSNIAILESRIKTNDQAPSTRWDCVMCQAKCNSEAHFEHHCAGRKHQQKMKVMLGEGDIAKTGSSETAEELLSDGSNNKNELSDGIAHQQNIAASCIEGNKSDMAKNIKPHEANSHERSVSQHAEKRPLVDCNICKVICGHELDLEIHLNGKKHMKKIRALLEESKNIAALCKEGSNTDMAKSITPHVAKSHESHVSRNAEKAPLARCSLCQVIFVRKSDLEIHLKTKRHVKKIQALLEESKNKSLISEPHTADVNLDSVPQHVEKTNCELDSESLRDERDQPNVQVLGEEINLEKSNPREIALGQIPSSEWDCAAYQDKCNSKAQFKHHCTNRTHQQRIKVILGEGDNAKVSSLYIEVPCKEGGNNDMVKNIVSREAKSHQSNVPEHAEKPPSVWSCSTCQDNCNCESDLDIHLMSNRIQDIVKKCRNMAMNSESWNAKLNPNSVPQHVQEINCKLNWESHHRLRDEKLQLMNDQALHEKINQDINSPPEIARDQIRSSEWDCAFCKAKCNSKAQFEHHCTSGKHRQKINVTLGEGNIAKVSSLHIEVPCKEDSSNDMVKNIFSQEAKSHKSNVPGHVEKPPLVSCSICQVICGRESDLEIHLNGKKHINKIRALLEESKIKAMNSESQNAKLNLNSVPQPAEKMNSVLDLESRLREERLRLREKNNQDKNNPPEIATDQIRSSEWDCAMCEAKCNSKAQFVHHCTSRNHQQKVNVTLGEGNTAKLNSLHVEVPCKEGSNNDLVKNIASQEAKSHVSNVPGRAEKPPLVGCSICQVICGRESDLEIHLKGKRHLKEIRALLEGSKNKATDSESQKANLNPDSIPQPAEITNCELDLEDHLIEERVHLMNDQALHERISQDKNNPPELAKDQIPISGWDCAMCQAQCSSKVQFENHCLSRRHQQKAQVIVGKDDIAETGSLDS